MRCSKLPKSQLTDSGRAPESVVAATILARDVVAKISLRAFSRATIARYDNAE